MQTGKAPWPPLGSQIPKGGVPSIWQAAEATQIEHSHATGGMNVAIEQANESHLQGTSLVSCVLSLQSSLGF